MHFWAVQSFSRCTFQLRREPGAAANRFSWSSTPDLENGHCSQGRGCFASCFGQVSCFVILNSGRQKLFDFHTHCLLWMRYLFLYWTWPTWPTWPTFYFNFNWRLQPLILCDYSINWCDVFHQCFLTNNLALVELIVMPYNSREQDGAKYKMVSSRSKILKR